MGLLCKLAFFAFVIYALVSIISVQVTLAEKKEQLATLEQKAEQLKSENDEYDRLLNIDDEKAYMEKIAMDKLNYAYPTEIRFYDTSRN